MTPTLHITGNRRKSDTVIGMKRTTLILSALTAGIIAGATATEIHETAQGAVVVMPYCATEDGSDYPGRHCLWVDPDTGRGYINGAATITRGGAD
jgi:hypothetical protein